MNVCYCKYKNSRRLDAEKGLNKPFENVLCLKPNQKFFCRKKLQIWTFFQALFFSGKINVKQVEEQKKKKGGGMLPRKIFESSRAVMVILVHFEQISSKLYRKFLPLILNASLVSIHGVLQTGFHIS